MFAQLKKIKDKCPFIYTPPSKKNNDDIINHDDADAYADDNTHELQHLLERCDSGNCSPSNSHSRSTTPNIPNTQKNILDKITSFFVKIKPAILSVMSKSYFITSCIGIYTKYYIVYKCSKKTTENYNNIIINLSQELSDKNIFFTKIFQGIANNANNKLINKELFHYFVNYTDNVKYDENEIDYRGLFQLISIAKSKGDELFIHSKSFINGTESSSVCCKPIKSGVIAIVYKATLNGKNVIIKYRRKNINEKFEKSLSELELLVNISKKLPFLSNLNICDIFDENREIMLGQLDFLNEVQNIKIFHNKFKDVKDIHIPYVYSYFTEENPDAIIMEYIEGERLENINEDNKDKYSKILSKFNIKSVFYDSIYHADLHSGNLIFMKELSDVTQDYTLKIGIIDYGIIGKLTKYEQNIFFNFFKILVSRNYEKLAKYIVNYLSEPIEKGEKGEKGEKCIKLIKNKKLDINHKLIKDIYDVCHKTLNVKQIFFGGEEIYEINKILKTESLTFSKFFCRIELSIAVSENVCNALCKDKTYVEQLMDAFKNLFCTSFDSIFDNESGEDEGEDDDEDEHKDEDKDED
jgi:predicted unusual protein kinase regulating ubiquinone biosynthesis (AarF/ABC1/UbiB family)